jgi:ribosomal protein S18 acetylase RimI-like enzyme
MNYRFLSNEDFPELTTAFNSAFSDYIVPINFTEEQLKNLYIQRHVDITRSLGVFSNGAMIGFAVNGFGLWNEIETVYNAGTGVIPSFRGLHIAEKMFEFIIPHFQKQGLKQYLLEVVTKNKKAFKLYEKLGFEINRKVLLMKAGNIFETRISFANSVDIFELKERDWNLLTAFWDGEPTWQNSVEAIKATIPDKTYLGAFFEKKCVGYIVFSAVRGVIAQFAVEKRHRRKGIGLALLTEMQKFIGNENKISVLNLDVEIKTALEFFQKRGFSEVVSQFEMIKKL